MVTLGTGVLGLRGLRAVLKSGFKISGGREYLRLRELYSGLQGFLKSLGAQMILEYIGLLPPI